MLWNICLIMVALLPAAELYGQCLAVQVDKTDEAHPSLVSKKKEYAYAVISDPDYVMNEPLCVAAAMRYLGELHEEQAIPKIVQMLNYDVPTPQCEGPGSIVAGIGTGCGPRGPYRWVKYPALDALHRLGKPATAALVHELATADIQSVESKNAFYALMDIYRENFDEIIQLLR